MSTSPASSPRASSPEPRSAGSAKSSVAINTRYGKIGASRSWIGLPTGLAKKTSYGKSQQFQHAAIHCYTSTGTAHVRVGFSTSLKTPKAADVPYTYRSGCPVGPSSLRMITLTFRNFSGDDQRGTIVVRSTVVSAITSVFEKAYAAGWPFRRVTPVDTYKGSDVRSMEADNTSAFNCRKVTGNPYRVSQHSYGNAIDINTFENPYVAGGTVYPKGSKTYLDRSDHRKGMILKSGDGREAVRGDGMAVGRPVERAGLPALLLERRVTT